MKLNKALYSVIMLAIITLFAAIAIAQNTPLGADSITVEQSEQANLSLYPPESTFAEAGNVTELTIQGTSVTKSWQGYYGNVTGTIILEDAQGNRFYDWSAAEPQGEIFASVNETITWTTVECAPVDESTYRAGWNTFYGLLDTDDDDINKTFSATDHPTFYVGYTTITGCRNTYTHVNSASQAVDFPAVLLASDGNSTLIFTAIIEDRTTGQRQGKIGFDGADHDFQVLVAENGQAGNSDLTQYYFWVELE